MIASRENDVSFPESLSRYVWSILLTAVIATFWWWFNPPAVPYLMADSASYLNFQATRDTGYPFLLHILLSISSADWWIKAVQLGVMVFAFSWLSLEVSRFFQVSWIAWLVQLLLVFNPLLMRYAFTVLSEGFFVSFFAIWLLASLRMLHLWGKFWTFLAAFSFAWVCLIKTVAVVWVPSIILIFAWIIKKRGWSRVKWDIGLFVLTVSIVIGGGAAYRGSHVKAMDRGSYTGGQLLGKLAFVPATLEKTTSPSAAAYLNELMIGVREARDSLSDYRQRFIFSLNFYDYIRFQHRDDILAKIEKPDALQDQAQQLSISIIHSNWKAYLDEVVMTVVAIWSMGDKQTQQFANDYNKQLDILSNHIPKDINLYQMTGDNSLFYISGHSSVVIYAIKGFMLLAFLVSLWFILGAFFQRWLPSYNRVDYALFFVSVATHSYIIGVALFQTALGRYTMMIWPLLLLLAFIGSWVIVRSHVCYRFRAVDH